MVTNSRLWTVNDLDALPNDGGWTWHEIVEGELLVTRVPHYRHQDAASNLTAFLHNWSRQAQRGKVLQAPSLAFSPHDAVIPDLIWISNQRIADGTDEAGHFTLAPELVVEVLSPGKDHEKRDREIKLQLYSKYSVQEYWILSWQQQTLEVYRRSNQQLECVNILRGEDLLSSPLFPGLSTPITQIFS